jgi:DNA-binding PadR family transcriptional regulator
VIALFKAHIKLGVLIALSQEPASGYDLIRALKEIGEATSPGYIYPLLSGLKRDGFITSVNAGRKKLYSLAPKGRHLLSELKRNRTEMLTKMATLLGVIASKQELSQVMKETGAALKENCSLADRPLIIKFHHALLAAYSRCGPSRTGSVREALRDSISRLERLGRRA